MGEDPAIPGQNLIWHSRDVDTGALYGVSNKYIYTASHNTFIRQDWLDKLGLPVPKTTQQFYDTMVAFKNSAAKLGVSRVVPFLLTSDVRWQAYNIFLSFMPPNLASKEKWTNTVAERQLLVPGVKDALRFLNKMYNDGLIDPDFPLYNDDQTPANVMKSGVVGAFQHNWDHPYRQNTQIQTDMEKNIPGAKYVPVDPFTNAAGVTPKRGSPAAGGLIFFIPKSSKNPEAALRYANWLAKYENYHFLQFGNEGVNHRKVNGVEVPVNATGPWIQNSGGNIDYTMAINGYVVPPAQFGEVLSASYPGIPPQDVTAAYQMSSLHTVSEPYVPATILSIAPVRQVLIDKEKVFCVNLICAKPADFDRVWDAGIKDWLASGAQAVIDEQKAKYR
jgi:putative aldouronate transport system substrate-binding protein